MSAEDITLRRLRESDLDAGLRLTQAERWPHRLSDWLLHYRIGDGWVAVENERVVGVAMWWNYADRVTTIGLVLVDQRLQGRGIGGRLMTAVMDSAQPCPLKLMATQAGLKLYENCGFTAIGEIGQTQGEVVLDEPVAAANGTAIREASLDDLSQLVSIDTEAFGAERSELICALLNEGRALIAKRDGRAIGYAVIRKSGHGQTIGPVVAADEELAIALTSELLAVESGFIRLDVDMAATRFSAWLATAGLTCIDKVTIMVRPEEPAAARELRTYGLASQALG